jgi:hypothetical protein
MAKASPGIVGFNSGEWSPAMESRTDTKGYATACFRLENFIPQVQGPARRRPGTRFVAEVKFSDRATALIPFTRQVSNAFMIEVGDFYMRFYQNHQQVVIDQGPNWNPIIGGTTTDGVLTWTNIGFPKYTFSTALPIGAILIDSNGNLQQTITLGSTVAPGIWLHPPWSTVVGGLTAEAIVGLTWVCLGLPMWAPTTLYGVNAAVYTPVGVQQVTAGAPGYSGLTVASTPYEIASPYGAADLFDSDNMFQLVFVQSADVLYITHRSTNFPAYKLSHFGPTHWTLAQVDFLGGPFADANPGTNPVVFASAETGDNITLTASSDIFDVNLMGALFQLTQDNIRTIRPWEPGVIIKKGRRRRFNGVTYEALNGTNLSNSPPSPLTGSIPPTHLKGQAYDAGGAQGILWDYRDPGFGFCRLVSRGPDPLGTIVNITNITAAKPPVVTTSVATDANNGELIFISGVGGMPEVNDKWYRVNTKSGNTFALFQDDTDGDGTNGPVDGTLWDPYTDSGTVSSLLWTATANVIQQTQSGTVNRLPRAVVFSQNATSDWAVGAFNNRDGYASTTSFFRGRLVFGRAGQVFMSVAADFENFATLNPGGVATADMGISITLPTQDPIQWLIEGRVLVVGTEGAEHVIQEINTGQAFGPSNIASKAQMRHGSRSIPPVLIGYSLLWIQTSGQKLRIMKYQFYTDQYQSEDLAALANHIFEKVGCNALAYQQEPDSVIWMIRGDNT